MKKIISLFIILLICVGCSSSDKLVKTSKDKMLSQLDNANIDSISIYDDDYTIFSFVFNDTDTFTKAKDAIKNINVSKKDASLNGDPLNVELYSEDGYTCIVLYDDAVKVTDTELNETIYYSDNSSSIRSELIDIVNENNVNDHYTSDGELVFEYEDLSGYIIGQNVNENGSHQVDIQFVNNSLKNYEIVMHSIVNDIYTHGYQSYMCFSSDTISYTIDTNDIVYQSFAQSDPSKIYYYFDIYEMDADSYKRLDLLYTSDPIELFNNGESEPLNLTPLFENEEIKLYSNLIDSQMYVQANFYIENKLTEDIKAKFAHLELNGELKEDIFDDVVTTIPVKANACSFNLIPIYTYEYDEESGDLSYFSADSIKFDVKIIVDDEIQTAKITLR